jgi:hypothetical protein
MRTVLDRLRSLATAVAEKLPSRDELCAAGAVEAASAVRVLAGIRASVDDGISLLAADIERQSARELGTDGLAQRNGFSDGTGFVQELTGVGRREAAQLIRVGGLLETAASVAPLPADAGADAGEPSLDSIAVEAEAGERYRMRSLKRVVRASGMVHYDIDLDPESDARFYGPIKRILSPRFGGPRFTTEADRTAAGAIEDDPRTNEQLQVDTLVDLIDRAVAADDGELFKTGEPMVSVAVTPADLAKAHAWFERRPVDHDGNGTASDHGIAWVDGSEFPITATDALRMICGAGFTPLLFDESGRAIDVGKDHRFFTRRQRRAMAKRDGGCMYPGCGRPPGDCEAHHVNPWAESPHHHKSEVGDGILLCRRHHKLVHDFGARIERRGTDFWLLWPHREARALPSKSAVVAELRAQGKVA